MKKSFKPMDQLFKDKFQGTSEPVDQDALWPYVEQRISKDKSKGVLFYFLSALLLLFLVFTLWVWANGEANDSGIVKKSGSPQIPSKTVKVQKSSTLPQKQSPTSLPEQALGSSLDKPKIENVSKSPFGGHGKKQNKESRFSASTILEAENRKINPARLLPLPTLNKVPLIRTTSNSSLNLQVLEDPDWSRCGDKNPLGVGFLLEGYVFGGYPLIANQLNNNKEIDYQNYLENWNKGETAIFSFSTGLLLGIETQWGGSISTGFEYQQIQNRLNQEQRVVERITVYDEMAYYYLDSNNNRVYVPDSVTTTRTYTRSLQTARTHTLINLPILLGYHQQIGKFRYGLIGGVNIHLQNEFKGKALDATGQIIDASNDGPTPIYRKNLSVSIIGGLDAGYMLQDGWEIYLSPRFRFQKESWLRSKHPLESRIQLVGLRAGVRLHL